MSVFYEPLGMEGDLKIYLELIMYDRVFKFGYRKVRNLYVAYPEDTVNGSKMLQRF